MRNKPLFAYRQKKTDYTPGLLLALLIASCLAVGFIGGRSVQVCQTESCLYAMHP